MALMLRLESSAILLGSRGNRHLWLSRKAPLLPVPAPSGHQPGYIHNLAKSVSLLPMVSGYARPLMACNGLVAFRPLLIPLTGDSLRRRWFTRRQEFAHRIKDDPTNPNLLKQAWHVFIMLFFCYLLIDVEGLWTQFAPQGPQDTLEHKMRRPWKKFWREVLRVDSASLPVVMAGVKGKTTEIESQSELKENDEKAKEEKEEKKKIGFRDRKIIEYENRIRSFSTPDKIFRYFATIKVIYDWGEGGGPGAEILMTPDDFLRALTPGLRQPEGLGLDQFKKIELTSKDKTKDFKELMSETLLEEQKKMEIGLKKDSIFYKLSSYGLITFSDFLFLLTVLSVSHRHFEIAFRMFDLNGDGNVDYEEFEKVQNAILQQTSIGQKLGALKSGSAYRGVSSALAKYFFGEDLKQKLTIEKFLDFQAKLQKEMLTLEFDRKNPDPVTGRITETDFGQLLIAYAGFPEKKRARMLKRVKKRYPTSKSGKNKEKDAEKDATEEGKEEVAERGISLHDYLQFFHFLQNIADVDIALTFFNMAGAGIDKATLKHAARTVASVDLRDQLLEVIFTLFDEDQDGQLSNREFISVMKERLRRGLAKPKDTGFMKLITAFYKAVVVDGFFL